MSLCAINSRPVICLQTDFDGGGLHVGYAATHTPPSPTAWDFVSAHNWDDAGSSSVIATQEIDSVEVPIISYLSNWGWHDLCYARPLVAEPTDFNDWHRVLHLDTHVSGISLALADGRPLIGYYQTDEQEIRCAWARNAQPADDTEWDYYTVCDGLTAEALSVGVVSIHDIPMIAFVDDVQDALIFGYLDESEE